MNLLPTSKRRPCPICGKPSWCSVREDGVLVICRRQSQGAVKEIRSGDGWVHILEDGPDRRGHGRSQR